MYAVTVTHYIMGTSELNVAESFGMMMHSLPGKYKYIQELNQCRDLLLLNYQLMDLVTHCREAIGDDNLKQIDQTLELYLQ
jgi:hypothetical protein